MNKTDLTIAIVSYNTRDYLRTCLASVYESRLGRYKIEVYVYDNASTDGSAEMLRHDFKQVKTIAGPENIGFAAANNVILHKSNSRYCLLLNSDTKLNPDTLKKMIEFMDSVPSAGVSTCKLLLPSGKIDPACHRGLPTPWAALTYLLKIEKVFPKSRLFGQYHLGYEDFNSTHEIDIPSGAFFMVRSRILEEVGYLDEDYFMYAEDIDWAYRIKTSGYKVFYNPEVICLHYKKQSGRSNSNIRQKIAADIAFHENNLLFYNKHLAKKYGFIITWKINALYAIRIFLLRHLRI